MIFMQCTGTVAIASYYSYYFGWQSLVCTFHWTEINVHHLDNLLLSREATSHGGNIERAEQSSGTNVLYGYFACWNLTMETKLVCPLVVSSLRWTCWSKHLNKASGPYSEILLTFDTMLYSSAFLLISFICKESNTGGDAFKVNNELCEKNLSSLQG
mmetsp:Transcript_15396/g.29003  ORF Transcript_15396/g.29003 Transcript_15396/m.29003 type:complete len:157 (-) Transcript_15396:15-485(-)